VNLGSLKVLGLLILVIAAIGATWMSARYLGPNLSHVSTGSRSSTNSTGSTGSTGTTGSQIHTVKVSLLLDFGNRTRLWFNDTAMPDNSNFYNVTYKIANGDVLASWSDQYSAHFVYKILGFGCVTTVTGCTGYWSLWVWNAAGGCWNFSSVGVDWLRVSNVGMVAWYFNYYDLSSFTGRCA